MLLPFVIEVSLVVEALRIIIGHCLILVVGALLWIHYQFVRAKARLPKAEQLAYVRSTDAVVLCFILVH